MIPFTNFADATNFVHTTASGECFVLVGATYCYFDRIYLRISHINELIKQIGPCWRTVLSVICEENKK